MNRNLKWVSKVQPVGQIQLPVLVNKLLLAQSHAHLFTCVSGCLHARTVVFNSPRRKHMANIAERISYLSGLLQKKYAGPRSKRKDFRSADVMSVSKQRLEILWPACMRCHTHCSRLAASVSQPSCIATLRFTRLFPVIV